MTTLTAAEFLRQVSEHRMTIEHEHGVFRHIRFAKPGTGCMHFNLTTFPGRLAITGDKGAWMFENQPDMVDFFRGNAEGGEPEINPDYWSSKLIACEVKGRGSSKGAVMVYDETKFAGVLWRLGRDLLRTAKHDGRDKEFRAGMLKHLRELLDWIDGEPRSEALRVADDWDYPGGPGSYKFPELWDHDVYSWCDSFLWACYAIVWGIQQYDRAKSEAAAAATQQAAA